MYLGFAGFLFKRGKKKAVVNSYLFVIFSAIFWTAAMIIFRAAPQSSSLFWCKALYVVAIFPSYSFYLFSQVFPYGEIPKFKKAVWAIISSLSMAVLVILPDLIIKSVDIHPGLEKEIIWGNLYFLYFLYVSGIIAYGLVILLKKYFKETGIIRTQLKYIFWGYFFGSGMAMFPNLLLPWVGIFKINWMGQTLGVITIALTVYAIIRYRLMDIRIVARKIFIYLGVAGFAYGIFYAIILLYNRVFGSVFSSAAYVSGIIIAPLFVLTFYALDRGLKHFANKYLFVSLYNYQETINNLTDELSHYIDIDKIIGLIVETIKKTMQLDRAGVLLADLKTDPVQYRIAKIIGFNEQNGISLVQDSFLTKHLQKIQKPLVRNEFLLLSRDSQDPQERQSFAKLFEHMKHIEASICLPLMSSDKLIGIIVLGAKISGDAYTKEDLDLLNTLSKQAGIAVDNALLYAEVKDFNASLKTEVAKATAELQAGKSKVEKAYEVEKQAREELQKLNQAKTEFLNLASHQLRTPTSVIKGIASMIKEGSFEKFPKEKQATFIEGLYDKSLKLEDIINDILNASEMTSTKFKMTPDHADWIDPELFIKELVRGFEPKLAERQIDLKISIEKSPLPKILCQQEFLKDAIGNLIENAIKYTPSAKADSYTRNIREGKAEINVSVFQKDKDVVFKIQDNGIGVPKEEITNIFKKFQRGSNARDMYTDGSGLGLFIVKEIIEGHGGRVWAESELGKGSSFFASLPTNPPKEINIEAVIIERAGESAPKTNA